MHFSVLLEAYDSIRILAFFFFLFFVSKVVAGISFLVMHYVWVIVLYVRLEFFFLFFFKAHYKIIL